MRSAGPAAARLAAAVTARLPETYQWLLAPVQPKPQSPVTIQGTRLGGQEPLAVRASKKLRSDELLLTSFAATRLRMELDNIPLWRGNHVPLRTLAEDFARYIYLPRLKDTAVLLHAVRDGVSLLTWQREGFALAEGIDEAAGRYRGLRGGQVISNLDASWPGLLVKGDVAQAQIEREMAPPPVIVPPVQPDGSGGGTDPVVIPPLLPPITPTPQPRPDSRPKRFHGTVTLNTTRAGLDASRIAEEVIAHLSGIVGARVTVTLEIEAEIPSGVPDNVVRTVTENSRTLKFTSQGFEKE